MIELTLKDIAPNNFYDQFTIDNTPITISLLDAEPANYNMLLAANDDLVIVQTVAFSCNFRDRALIHHFNEQCRFLSKGRKYFYSPIGSEFAGVIVEIGKKVTSLQIGDRVMCNMSYPVKGNNILGGVSTNFASQRILILHESDLIKIPDSMSNEEAACFCLSSQTAYSMIRKANLQEGEKVLITSATSNTSLTILQNLLKKNIEVHAITNRGDLLIKTFKDNKIKKIYSPQELTKESLPNCYFDVVFDPFVDIHFSKISPALNYNARYIYCGMYMQSTLYEKAQFQISSPYEIWSTCISKNVSLIGNCLGVSNDLVDAINDYQKGLFSIKIDSIYSLNDINAFLTRTFLDKHRIGKVIYKY